MLGYDSGSRHLLDIEDDVAVFEEVWDIIARMCWSSTLPPETARTTLSGLLKALGSVRKELYIYKQKHNLSRDSRSKKDVKRDIENVKRAIYKLKFMHRELSDKTVQALTTRLVKILTCLEAEMSDFSSRQR